MKVAAPALLIFKDQYLLPPPPKKNNLHDYPLNINSFQILISETCHYFVMLCYLCLLIFITLNLKRVKNIY